MLPGGLGGQTVVAPEENFDGEDCVVEEVSEVVVAKEVDVPPEVVVIVEVGAVGDEIQHRTQDLHCVGVVFGHGAHPRVWVDQHQLVGRGIGLDKPEVGDEGRLDDAQENEEDVVEGGATDDAGLDAHADGVQAGIDDVAG